MTHASTHTASLACWRERLRGLGTYVVCGAAAMMLVVYFAPQAGSGPSLLGQTIAKKSAAQRVSIPSTNVNRTNKGDRLTIRTSCNAENGAACATSASISRMSRVPKRETPVDATPVRPAVPKRKIPEGCDPALSTLVNSAAQNFPSRCLS
jgi:hypothetical protein